MGARTTSSHLAGEQVGTEELREIGQRFAHIRGSATQMQFGERIGIHKNTVGTYERGEREIGALALARIAEMGWNANWLLTGEGQERPSGVAETRAGYESQDLSEEQLTIALEITDDIIRTEGARYVPRTVYARILRLMYQGIAQGLPVADVHDIGQQAVRAAISGTGVDTDGSQSGVGGPGQGGGR